MTELMKRYEEKMDLKKDSIKMQYVYDRFIEGFEEFAQEEYDALQSENTRLKAQLTWRPVTQGPKEEGLYFLKVVLHGRTDCEHTEIITRKYTKDLGWGSFFSVTRLLGWLPIPPAPEDNQS